MKLWMLGSGSSGNAVLVESGGARLLVDCGFGPRTLAKRLAAAGVAPESIDACLITHEHTDHVKGAAAGAKKWGWTLHATPGTAASSEVAGATVQTFEPGASIEFPTLTATATRTPHDAMQSVGFVLECRSTGARAGVFTDLGYVTRGLAKACASLDLLVLESNHDEDMLIHGPYAPWLKRRIASRAGHLSNPDAARFAREMAHRELAHVVIAHLSEENNSPAVAMASMRAGLGGTRFQGTLTAAQQDAVVGPFLPGTRKAEAPLQYSLF